MASSQSTAIQCLLDAEQKAAASISNAREERKEQLKRAKAEANAEVERYRQELMAKFESEHKQAGGSADNTERESQKICDEYTRAYAKNKTAALNWVMSRCLDVKLEYDGPITA